MIHVTDEEFESLLALSQTIHVLGAMFEENEEAATPASLRMAAATIRASADVFEQIAGRQEREVA